jgi:hypothetical protein
LFDIYTGTGTCPQCPFFLYMGFRRRGGRAGAAFFDAFASLSVVDLKVQDDLTVTGDIDVDGTTNLDVVDIDGAVDMASTALVTGVLDNNSSHSI